MDNQELLKQRVNLFHQAVEFKKVSRVPLHANTFSSKICDTGYKLSEALFDYDIFKDVMRKYHEKYNFDTYHENGFRNPLRIPYALSGGSGNYVINDEKNSINFPDVTYMKDDEYDDIIEDFEKYIWSKFIFHKYPDLTKEKLFNGIKETAALGALLHEVDTLMMDEYGVPPFFEIIIPTPFEYIFNGMRGFKESSLDLRRRADKLEQSLKVIRKTFNHIDMIKPKPPGPSPMYCFDIHSVLMGYYIMNNKQFERFYWPYLKEIIDYAVENDKRLYLFTEGSTERFYEFFQDIPKGYVAIHLELDDIFEAKKKIGDNICLCGGFPTDLLKEGTPQKCVDYAKHLIDELGAADGGYIFSMNKMLSFKSDVNEENMKAINEFVLNYAL